MPHSICADDVVVCKVTSGDGSEMASWFRVKNVNVIAGNAVVEECGSWFVRVLGMRGTNVVSNLRLFYVVLFTEFLVA